MGIFLAPPCGTASRARSIPLKRKQPGDPDAPRPLRSDRHLNGLPFLLLRDRIKVCQANKLYHLTAKLVKWAVETGCIFCIETPQCSFFWQTSFIQEVIHHMQFTTFQSCRHGSRRPKRTMLGFNVDEFEVINKMCEGVSSSHRHDGWGLNASAKKFATAMETAYPMPLARLIAAQFILALQRLGISMPAQTPSEISCTDNAVLPVLRAQAGGQPKAARLPPLIPHFAATLTGFRTDLPSFEVLQKVQSALAINTTNAPTTLPKGSKLLQLCPAVLPSTVCQGGVFASRQHLSQEEVDRIVLSCKAVQSQREGICETQVWGIPWTEEELVRQMVDHWHPAALQSCLPDVLKDTVEVYKALDAHQRVSVRAAKLGYWLKALKSFREAEVELKQSMDLKVAAVLEGKNICLWEAMLKSVQYTDMGVVAEFKQGSDLVGCTETTGLWPLKFQPATISLNELHDVAARERLLLHQQFLGGIGEQFLEEVWSKTQEEVEAGSLVGPLALHEVPVECPLSRRFVIKQGPKVRCIDDFSRSSVNSCVHTTESPKPQTLDVFAALCVYVMSACPKGDAWQGRTFDLVGAYCQCAVRPTSRRYAHIMVQGLQKNWLRSE